MGNQKRRLLFEDEHVDISRRNKQPQESHICGYPVGRKPQRLLLRNQLSAQMVYCPYVAAIVSTGG
jgi:hypothetical protein